MRRALLVVLVVGSLIAILHGTAIAGHGGGELLRAPAGGVLDSR